MAKTTKEYRNLRPSRAVVSGGAGGAVFAPLIVAALAQAGIPVTAELAAAIGPALGAIVAYFTRGGRRGEHE